MQRVLTVFELNEYVRKTLARDPMLRQIQLRGEISNMKRYPSGHWYFSLKDENARINCVMFRQNNYLVGKPPVDGESIILTGSVSLYSKDGSYQFYVEALKRDGVGELYARFLETKARLESLGLFDAAIKKPLPSWPKKIGIITSEKGAVVHDIKTVAARRNAAIPLVLYPVKVQGEGAAEEMIEALRFFNAVQSVDVIIIGRGGGSIEDLWAFNDERLAMAIHESLIPVVSAVGHETDFTIADFVADVRAATPSMAAEICVWDKKEWEARLRNAISGMAGIMQMAVYEKEGKLANLQKRLLEMRPDKAILNKQSQLEMLKGRIDRAANKALNERTQRFERLRGKLAALSPKAVLKRGYALGYRNGALVTRAVDLKIQDTVDFVFADGLVGAIVEKIQEEHA